MRVAHWVFCTTKPGGSGILSAHPLQPRVVDHAVPDGRPFGRELGVHLLEPPRACWAVVPHVGALLLAHEPDLEMQYQVPDQRRHLFEPCLLIQCEERVLHRFCDRVGPHPQGDCDRRRRLGPEVDAVLLLVLVLVDPAPEPRRMLGASHVRPHPPRVRSQFLGDRADVLDAPCAHRGFQPFS